MKRPLLILFFASLAILFIWLWSNRDSLSSTREARKVAKTIVPLQEGLNREGKATDNEITSIDESRIQPLVPLENDESFLQAISMDVNKDGITDQICAVKSISEQHLLIVAGLQNPLTGEYTRLQAIRTGVSQGRTLLMYAADVIGDRSQCLVFSGMTSDNTQLLSVFLPKTDKDGRVHLQVIADLRSDGSILVKEVQRTDAYNLGVTSGESFPIAVYSSDPDSPESLAQIERIYRWDRNVQRYEKASEAKIPGKRLERRLVDQLQSGNIESFEQYLNGLWYMTSSIAGKGPRYVFFDSPMKEIVFHNEITEEIFTREAATPRRLGAYLTTRNRSISSIRRMIDIELTGIDEIKIKILEDVKLKIGVASDWDGIYRKMSGMSSGTRESPDEMTTKLGSLLSGRDAGWKGDDGTQYQFTQGIYTKTDSIGKEMGSYALLTVKGLPVLQMRPDDRNKTARFYRVETEVDNAKQKVILTEVSVSIDGTKLAGIAPIILRP